MADLFTVSIHALLRETATSVPHWSTEDLPVGTLAPTKSFRMELLAGPGALSVPMPGFVLVQYLIIMGTTPGSAYELTYRDNAGITHANILCSTGLPVCLTSVSPALNLSILPFGGGSINVRIHAVGV